MLSKLDLGFLAVAIVILLCPRAPFIPTKTPAQLRESYDFIIVGGGSGGAALASRLSDTEQFSVLLIEAGGTGTWASHVPGLVAFNQRSALDWEYQTSSQNKSCFSLEENKSRWPRGKVLGGSSVLNALFHVWGRPEDHDRWEKELGCDGWGWTDVLPFYKRTESIQYPTNIPDIRGTEGAVKTTKAPRTPLGKAFEEAVKESKELDFVDEYNGLDNLGISTLDLTIFNGKRQSTRDAYLLPVKLRKNLHILTNAHVTKVLFNSEKRAIGVEYVHDSQTFKVLADKEVVLSGGAINTPQILMLSGVGPRDHLEEHKIPVVLDSPAVGANLKDHIIVKLLYEVNSSMGLQPMAPFSLSNTITTFKDIARYSLYGDGIFATTGGELMGFDKSGLNPHLEVPDTQYYFFPLDMSAMDFGLFNIKKGVKEDELKNSENSHYFTVASTLQQTASVGSIRLNSSDPFDHPIIDPNYFDDPKDVRLVTKGLMKLHRIIMESKTLKKYGVRFSEGPLSACAEHEFLSENYFDCYVRHKSLTVYHPESTCRMGKHPKSSVVDLQLRVHGLKGLRIVDASVFPDIMTGNPNIPVIMVAEKAAELVTEKWKR